MLQSPSEKFGFASLNIAKQKIENICLVYVYIYVLI